MILLARKRPGPSVTVFFSLEDFFRLKFFFSKKTNPYLSCRFVVNQEDTHCILSRDLSFFHIGALSPPCFDGETSLTNPFRLRRSVPEVPSPQSRVRLVSFFSFMLISLVQ